MDEPRPPAEPARSDPERPLAGPPDPWHWAEKPVDRGGPPWSHDRDDRGGAGVRRALPDAARRGRAGRPAASARRRDPGGRRGGCADRGDRLRDERARGAGGRRDPARRVAAGRAAGSRPGRRPGVRGGARAAGGARASGSATRAARGRRRGARTARAAGARTALVTVRGRVARGAAVPTSSSRPRSGTTSWCHTVGYLSPLVAGRAIGRLLTGETDACAPTPRPSGRCWRPVSDPRRRPPPSRSRRRLAGVRLILVIASGADRPAARELVLKVEEGDVARPRCATSRRSSTATWPRWTPATGLVLDPRPTARSRPGGSTGPARRSAAAAHRHPDRGDLSAGVAAELAPALTPAGRIVVPAAPELPPPGASLLGSAAPLQLLAERLARARARNPTRSAARIPPTPPRLRRPEADRPAERPQPASRAGSPSRR